MSNAGWEFDFLENPKGSNWQFCCVFSCFSLKDRDSAKIEEKVFSFEARLLSQIPDDDVFENKLLLLNNDFFVNEDGFMAFTVALIEFCSFKGQPISQETGDSLLFLWGAFSHDFSVMSLLQICVPLNIFPLQTLWLLSSLGLGLNFSAILVLSLQTLFLSKISELDDGASKLGLWGLCIK